MTASRRRASLSLNTPVDEVADAILELLKEEFGPDLDGGEQILSMEVWGSDHPAKKQTPWGRVAQLVKHGG